MITLSYIIFDLGVNLLTFRRLCQDALTDSCIADNHSVAQLLTVAIGDLLITGRKKSYNVMNT